MMKQEFEQLAGYEVSYETYNNIIEPMYMALPNGITKQDFVKMLNKKAFALPTKKELISKMRKIAQYIFDNCGIRGFYDEQEELMEIARQYAKQIYGIDGRKDEEGFIYTNPKHAYRGCLMDRGCSYPDELVIVGRKYHEIERIQLVKR